CPQQLDLAMGLFDCVDDGHYDAENGSDCRNYGGLDGLAEAKALFAELMEVETDEIIIGGNSSLNMMHDAFMRAMINGVTESSSPWKLLPKVKFLCPSPGYDRHFSVCQYLGIEMITIDMKSDGPDEDDSIKGIWCVPKYSNPTGTVYSDSVVDRLAGMKTKADDFTIFWDNAYVVHHLGEKPAGLKNILTACKQAGHADRVLIFGSTSKISFASAGLAMMAGSKASMDRVRKQISFQTIGPDKLNQLRHVTFFKNMAGIEDHMKKHAAILKPKFDAVQTALETELGGKNIANWSQPAGGYFVNVDTMEGCAGPVVQMAAEAGVKLTPAGSTFPYMKDPLNRNFRLAPSFPALEDIHLAMELVGICIQLVSIEKILAGRD
ncbi:MAG: aminotransferase class I/II-fold pyridoxal phosphate-dependent enzyme, partial [Deltaproteobacteria bacterium]|nr:aminotransferase class I/II-fold pyridoxal phosphate-dependent enzyme [Deltaproteobacteria bacterium]